MSNNDKPIGKFIQEKLKESGRSVVWFAKEMGCDRTNAYKIFDKTNIDIVQLRRISKILNYNFFNHCS